MKKLGLGRILALLWLIFPVLLFSQIEQWVARYNGTASINDIGNAIVVDSQGNAYITGATNESFFVPGDFLTIKYNYLGQEQWVATYDGEGGYDEARDLVVDDSGNVYVTGRSFGITTDADYSTIKYNSSGQEQWVNRYNGPSNAWDYAIAIAIDSKNNVIVTGFSYESITNNDFITIKYNQNGDEKWIAKYNGTINCHDEPASITVDESDNIYVVGTSDGPDSSIDYLTIKYDLNGVEQWVARYNGGPKQSERAWAVTSDRKCNIYVTGGNSNWDYLTIKYDTNGQARWIRTHNGTGNSADEAKDIAVDYNGNVYVTGDAASNRSPYYDFDYLTIKYDSTGNLLWEAIYNGPRNSNDMPYGGIAIDSSGNVYVTGVSWDRDDNTNYCTIKYGSEGEEQWAVKYVGPSVYCNFAYDIAVDQEGYVYVTGGSAGFSDNYDCVTIKYSNYAWTKTRPMPEGLKKKKVKYGGSLVVVSDSLIFALKGNKTNEFYAFDITNQTWSQKCSLPTVTAKKLVKKGAALTYGNDIIYATRGNKTSEFWAYFVNGDSWKRLKDVPLGTGKNLKGGTGLAFVTKADSDFVYLLKGSKTNEFWVYYANQDTWLKRKDAPILPSEKYYKDGSSIVYDGNNTIYALKSKTNEFYAYDISNNIWTDKQTLPIIGISGKKKKVKNGGAIVWADSSIYAFKGGNTLEFWQYLPGFNTWVQKESLPAGEKKKRIKGGGALAYIEGKVYALKGNNTLEFWVYTPKSGRSGVRLRRTQFGPMAQTALGGLSKKPINQINIYPNPFSKTTTLNYTLSCPGSFSIALYDISGRLLRQVNKETKSAIGSTILNFEGLNSGVYFLLFKSVDYKTTKKVIMN